MQILSPQSAPKAGHRPTPRCHGTDNQPSGRWGNGRCGNGRCGKWAAWWFIGLFCLGTVATAVRVVKQYQTPGPFDPARQGYCDFHNGIYYPTLAWLRGVSPYGQTYAAEYPVARSVPFFSPAIFVLHTPWAVLPLHVAEVLYFGFSLCVVWGIAALVSRAARVPADTRRTITAAVAAGIVFSRGGHITLFDGYFTLLLVLGTLTAIHFGRTRPWLAAVGLLLASAKPTYILPLGLLLLARGHLRALIYGAALSITFAGIGFGWLAFHQGDGDVLAGMQELRQQISVTQEIHRGETDESPLHSWTRIDLFAVVAKWTRQDPADAAHLLVMLGLILPPCAVLWWRRRRGIDDGLAGLTGAVITTAMLVCLYHQSYDALLVVAAVTGLAVAGKSASGCQAWRGLPLWQRGLLGLLLVTPAFNYLSTRMVLTRLPVGETTIQLLTSVNGMALAVALVWLCILGVRDATTTSA